MPPPPPEIFASSVGRGLPDAPLLEVLAGDFAAPAEICCFGGEISPPAGGEFLSQRWERNQWPRPPALTPSGQFTLRIAGGRLRMSAPRPYSPLPIPSGLRPSPLDKGSRPPVPRYGGRSSESLYIISGAQNLSGCLNSRRATGPWVCKNCRCCGSIHAPRFSSQRRRVH